VENSALSRAHAGGPTTYAEELGGRWAESVLLLALLAVFAWKAFVPAWRTLNTDFPSYYLAARLYRQGYPLKRVYDWVWFQRQKDHARVEHPLVSFTPNPPVCILPVLPFSSLPPLAAKRAWLVFNLVLLGGAILLLNSIVQLGLGRVAIIAFLALDALQTNFLFGQEHLLIASLLALAAFFYFRGSKAAAGAILACGAALKIYPALFLFYFLRKKQWRAVAGLALCSLGLGFLSLALFGFETVRYYTIELLPRYLAGEVINPYDIHWSSFTALLHRMFLSEPELNPHPLVHLPVAYAVLQPLCQALLFVPTLWLISSSPVAPAKEKLEWGTYVVLLLILSTSPAPYHFCALIVAGVLATNYLLETGQRGKACILLALYALVCLPVHRGWSGPLTVWLTAQACLRLGALTALWVLLLWVLSSRQPEALRVRLKSRQAAAFGLLMLALVTAGVCANLRHLNGLFANYAARLLVREGSGIATDPTVAGERVFFTTMVRSGYTIASLDRGSMTNLALGSDAFHLTASESGDGWVELASASSRVVRFPLRQLPFTPDGVVVEAEEAEQPAVSREGKWLAFIREARGHAGLWVKELLPKANSTRAGAAGWQAGGDESSVLEAAFFPDDRIVFAAETGPSTALFALDPETRSISPLSVSSQPTRYPAVSPDGQWLAYSQDEMGSWQLWVMRFSTGEKRRVTLGDCNSIAPARFGDSKTLVYATDCGRAVGLTALCRVRAVP